MLATTSTLFIQKTNVSFCILFIKGGRIMFLKFKRLFLTLVVIILIPICVGCKADNVNEESKIQKLKDVNEYLDEVFDSKEVEKVEGWSGIEVWIFCDYSKHEKYDEWREKYNLKDSYSSSGEKYADDYFGLLNSACYELIKDKFTNGEFTKIGTSEFLYFTYSSQENLDKDYKGFEEMAKQEYVKRIVIQETYPSQYADE